MDSDSIGSIQKYVLKEHAKNNILDLFVDWNMKRGVEFDEDTKDFILELTDELVDKYSVTSQVDVKKLEIENKDEIITEDFVTLSAYEEMFNEFMEVTTRLMIEVIGIELEVHLNKIKE